jgi:uncharacterized membrane protein
LAAHLYIAHAPYVLIVVGLLADLAGVATANQGLRRWAGSLLIAGGIIAFFAFFTGSGATGQALTRAAARHTQIEVHAQWGSIGAWLLLAAAVLRARWRRRLTGTTGWLALGAAALSAALVIGITLSGLAIAHRA